MLTIPLKTVLYTAIYVVVLLGTPFEQSFCISPHIIGDRRPTRVHFTSWQRKSPRLSALRCTESQCACRPSGQTDQPSSSHKQRPSSIWQRSNANEQISTTFWHNSASGRVGRYHNFTIRAGALRPSGAPVVQLTRSVSETAHEEMGDRKPLQFLRQFKRLALDVPDDFLRTVCSSRLPPHVRAILVGHNKGSLGSASHLEDRIFEVTPLPNTTSIGARQHSRATRAHRGPLAPGRLNSGITDPQPLAVRRPSQFALQR